MKTAGEQKKLAFELHDWNDDGFIDPADLFDLFKRLREHDFCINEDLLLLNRKLSELEKRPSKTMMSQTHSSFQSSSISSSRLGSRLPSEDLSAIVNNCGSSAAAIKTYSPRRSIPHGIVMQRYGSQTKRISKKKTHQNIVNNIMQNCERA